MRSRSARIRGWIITRPASDEGATVVEYGLLLGAIALVIVPLVFIFGQRVAELYPKSLLP